MGAGEKTREEYYFVPLGRELGGLLDVLGLPANADAAIVAAKENEHRRQFKLRAVEQRKKWKEKQESGEITPEELAVREEEVEKEKNSAELHFNELKKQFELLQNERRRLAKEGRRDETTAWAEAFQSFETDADAFWRFLVATRPLPQVTEVVLDALMGRWLQSSSPTPTNQIGDGFAADVAVDFPYFTKQEIADREQWFKNLLELDAKRKKAELQERLKRSEISPEEAKRLLTEHQEEIKRTWAQFTETAAAAFSKAVAPQLKPAGVTELAHSRLFADAEVKLETISGLVAEREMLVLLAADSLWDRLRGTNREFWRKQLTAWIDEIGRLGPYFDPQPNGHAEPATNDEWPWLSRVPDRTVDRLEVHEIRELSHAPDRANRRDPESQADVARMLAGLLGRLGDGSDPDDAPAAERAGATGRPSGAPPGFDELRELFERLKRTQVK